MEETPVSSRGVRGPFATPGIGLVPAFPALAATVRQETSDEGGDGGQGAQDDLGGAYGTDTDEDLDSMELMDLASVLQAVTAAIVLHETQLGALKGEASTSESDHRVIELETTLSSAYGRRDRVKDKMQEIQSAGKQEEKSSGDMRYMSAMIEKVIKVVAERPVNVTVNNKPTAAQAAKAGKLELKPRDTTDLVAVVLFLRDIWAHSRATAKPADVYRNSLSLFMVSTPPAFRQSLQVLGGDQAAAASKAAQAQDEASGRLVWIEFCDQVLRSVDSKYTETIADLVRFPKRVTQKYLSDNFAKLKQDAVRDFDAHKWVCDTILASGTPDLGSGQNVLIRSFCSRLPTNVADDLQLQLIGVGKTFATVCEWVQTKLRILTRDDDAGGHRDSNPSPHKKHRSSRHRGPYHGDGFSGPYAPASAAGYDAHGTHDLAYDYYPANAAAYETVGGPRTNRETNIDSRSGAHSGGGAYGRGSGRGGAGFHGRGQGRGFGSGRGRGFDGGRGRDFVGGRGAQGFDEERGGRASGRTERAGGRGAGRAGGVELAHIQCYHCREFGHFRDRCPKVQCHACKEYGHYKSDCPNVGASGSNNVNLGEGRPNGRR